jgi:hypothetical protein
MMERTLVNQRTFRVGSSKRFWFSLKPAGRMRMPFNTPPNAPPAIFYSVNTGAPPPS